MTYVDVILLLLIVVLSARDVALVAERVLVAAYRREVRADRPPVTDPRRAADHEATELPRARRKAH